MFWKCTCFRTNCTINMQESETQRQPRMSRVATPEDDAPISFCRPAPTATSKKMGHFASSGTIVSENNVPLVRVLQSLHALFLCFSCCAFGFVSHAGRFSAALQRNE